MTDRTSRRWFLGMASGLMVSSQLSLDRLEATESSGTLGDFEHHVRVASGQSALNIQDPAAAAPTSATEDNILGPYFRPGAPFRGKVTPPLEPGQTLIVFGRVLGLDNAQPPRQTVLHVWQANADGRYDNDDPEHPPAKGVFVNRARLAIDETGYYEYETIHPGRYRTGPNQMRPAHIHYHVEAAGYTSLTTQMYFEGDPENANDPWVKPSLVVKPQWIETPRGKVEVAEFNIILKPAAAAGNSR